MNVVVYCVTVYPFNMFLGVERVFKISCALTVLFFTIQCFIKFINSETGSRVKYHPSSKVLFPDLTLCWVMGYKKNVMKKYGFHSRAQVFDEGDFKNITSIVDFMKISRLYLEEFLVSLNIFTMSKVEGSYKNLLWSPEANHFNITWLQNAFKREGMCYTMSFPQSLIQANIMRVSAVLDSRKEYEMERTIDFRDQGWKVILHTPGQLRRTDFNVLTLQTKTKYLATYDVTHALYKKNNKTSKCDYEMNKGFDHCWMSGVRERMMSKIGCIFPWHLNQIDIKDFEDKICQNQSFYLNGGIEDDVISELQDSSYRIDCGYPCDFLIFNFRLPKESRFTSSKTGDTVKRGSKIVIQFNKEISITEEFKIYEFLSLMGEAGGYLGLFLGTSFYELFVAAMRYRNSNN